MKYRAYPKYKDSGVAWLGEVPKHWDSLPIRRRLLGIKDGTHGSFERVSEGIPLLSAKNVLNGQIIIGDNESLISREDWADITSNGFPRLGDILLTIVGSIGRTAVFNINKPMAFQRSVAFLRFQKNQVSEFIRYGIESASFQAQLQSFTKVAAQGGTYMGDVVRGILAFPPETEQQIISDFLDRETDKIDNLLAKKRALIEKLKEKRTALISRTVTRGLPPEAARAAGLDPHPKLKSSGVEWLGDVPEHWGLTAVGFQFRNLDHRRIPVAGEIRAVVEKIYPYYGASGIIDYIDDYLFDEPLVLVAEDGANLLSRSTPLAFLARGKYWVNNHAHILRPLSGDIRYWVSVLQTFDYTPLISGAAQPKLTSDRLNSVRIPKPPIAEQSLIADYLDRETEKIDHLTEKVEAAIDRLQEYRTALITAAVTGKIDVRPEADGCSRTNTDRHGRTRTGTDEHGQARTDEGRHGRARTG